jgi:hypothetical protein
MTRFKELFSSMMMATLVKTGTEFDFKGSKATRD